MQVMPGLATFLSLRVHIKYKPTESKVHVCASVHFEKVVAPSFENWSNPTAYYAHFIAYLPSINCLDFLTATSLTCFLAG